MNFKQLLTNQTVLYVTLAISLASLIGYMMSYRNDAVLFFLLVGFITSHFSKNMTVIMLAALLITNLVFGMQNIREGMENKDTNKDISKTAKSSKNRMPTDEDLELAEGEDPEDEGMPPASAQMDAKMSGNSSTGAMAGKVNANGKSMKLEDTDDVKPSDRNANNKKKNMNFSHFEKALENTDIGKLGNEMDDMVAKHEKLENMIQNMGPIIDKAGKLLDRVNTTNIGGIGDIVNKMSGFLGKM